MHHYDNMQCTSLEEFEADLARFTHLFKLINRYSESGELRERLILNHIIVLYNLFNSATTDMLLFKIDQKYWGILFTFLVYLNYVTYEQTIGYELDPKIITVLRSL